MIGFVGTDNTGLGGIEAKYDKALSGTNGFIMRSTTAAGTDLLYTSWEDYFDAVPGSDVELTIDATIQYYVEKHLAQPSRTTTFKTAPQPSAWMLTRVLYCQWRL